MIGYATEVVPTTDGNFRASCTDIPLNFSQLPMHDLVHHIQVDAHLLQEKGFLERRWR